MTAKKILICGLPGSGKTTLGQYLSRAIGAVHWDGDEVRKITNNQDFSLDGRLAQARAMRDVCNVTVRSNVHAVASFIAPTPTIRDIFWADFTVYLDRAVACPYRDTNYLWQAPVHADFVVGPGPLPVTPAPYVDEIIGRLFPGHPPLADNRMLDIWVQLDAIGRIVSSIRANLPMRVYKDVDRDTIIPPSPVLASVHVADAIRMAGGHRRHPDPSGTSHAFDTFGADDTAGC